MASSEYTNSRRYQSLNACKMILAPTGPKGDMGATGKVGQTGPTGPIGYTGPKGLDGSSSNTGATGPTGMASPWGVGNAGVVYYTGGNVGVGTNTPTSTLDISGNMHVSGNVILSSVAYMDGGWSEKLGTVSVVTAGSVFTCNYKTGIIFYLPNPGSGNIQINVIHLPSVNDTTHQYSILLAFYAGSSTNYCDTVSISNTGTISNMNWHPLLKGGVSSLNIQTGNFVIQKIQICNFPGNGYPILLSSVDVYS